MVGNFQIEQNFLSQKVNECEMEVSQIIGRLDYVEGAHSHLSAAFHEGQETLQGKMAQMESVLQNFTQTAQTAVAHEIEKGKLEFEIVRRKFEVEVLHRWADKRN